MDANKLEINSELVAQNLSQQLTRLSKESAGHYALAVERQSRVVELENRVKELEEELEQYKKEK